MKYPIRKPEKRTGSPGKSLLLQYFLTYILVLAAPVILFSLFHYFYTFSILKDNIIQDRTKNLERTSDLILTQLEQLENIVIRMSYSSEFMAYVYDDDPFSAYQMMRYFGQYTMTNKFLSGGYIFLHGEDSLYSDLSSLSLDMFVQRYFSGETEILGMLESPRDRAFLRTDDQLAVLFNFPLGDGSMSLGKIIFFVDVDTMGKFFFDTATRYEIRSEDGSPLFVSPFWPEEEGRTFTIRYQAEKGLAYLNIIPESLVSADLRRFSNSFLWAVFLFLLVSFPLVFRLATAQTNPITRLNEYVRKATGGGGEMNESGTDEFQSIHDNIDSYIRKTNPALKTQIIMDFVNGKISSLDQVGERTGLHEWAWGARFHTILSLLNRDGTRISHDDFVRLESMMGERREGGIREYMLSNSLLDNRAIIIIGFDDDAFDSVLGELFGRALSKPWILGCGMPKQSPEMLNVAYSEAQRALEYGLYDGRSAIVHFGDITEENTEELSAHVSRLQKFLFEKTGIGKVQEELDNLQALLKEKSVSLFQLKSVYYELLNMAVIINKRGQYPDTFEIEKVTSIDELIGLIQGLIRQAFLESAEEREVIPDYIWRIEEFIENNITDKQLSLTHISDNFDLSPSYVSRSFKKYRDVNISSFIASLRLDMAKELLRNSTLPVQEIIMSVGYSDASSFSRLFKKEEKIPPGEYRAKMAALPPSFIPNYDHTHKEI